LTNHRYALLFLWIAVIFVSSTSVAEVCDSAFQATYHKICSRWDPQNLNYQCVHFIAEKSVHVVLFFALSSLLWKIIPAAASKEVVILGIVSTTGCASELIQTLFPKRDPTIRDVLIDVGGAVLGLVMVRVASNLQKWRLAQARCGHWIQLGLASRPAVHIGLNPVVSLPGLSSRKIQKKHSP